MYVMSFASILIANSWLQAYLSLLNRNESSFSHEEIMKDICCLVHRVRDKYSVCAALLDHIGQVTDDENRMYIEIHLYRTILKCSISTRLKQNYLNLTRLGGSSELELLGKEKFMQHIWQSPANSFEELLRCELLFCACREFLLLKPDPSDEQTFQAWLDIGIELCEQGKDCLIWDDCPSLNTTISEFGKALTRLCAETHRRQRYGSNERKKVTRF